MIFNNFAFEVALSWTGLFDREMGQWRGALRQGDESLEQRGAVYAKIGPELDQGLHVHVRDTEGRRNKLSRLVKVDSTPRGSFERRDEAGASAGGGGVGQEAHAGHVAAAVTSELRGHGK